MDPVQPTDPTTLAIDPITPVEEPGVGGDVPAGDAPVADPNAGWQNPTPTQGGDTTPTEGGAETPSTTDQTVA